MSIFDDPTIIPGKTLDQPYAGAVWLAAMGYQGKDIETRGHRFTRVGKQIVICAGLQVNRSGVASVLDLYKPHAPPEIFEQAMRFEGVAIVLARVVECRQLTVHDYHRAAFYGPNRWAWILSDMKPLRPFPVRGIPGFIKVPRDRVEQALKEAA